MKGVLPNYAAVNKMAKNLKYLFLLLLVLSHPLLADGPIPDSVRVGLDKAPDDTNKVNLLNTLSMKAYKVGNYPPSLEYSNRAVILSEKLKYSKGLRWAYSNLGSVYCYKGDYANSLAYHFKALKIREKEGLLNEMAWSNTNIGNVYLAMNNNEETMRYYTKSLRISEKTGDKPSMCYSYNSLGNIHFKLGHFNEALDNFKRSLELSTGTLAHKQNTANALNNIGEIYRQLKNYKEARRYYFDALAVEKEIQDNQGIGIVHLNIGSIYFEEGNYTEAKKYCLKSLEIAKSIDDLVGEEEAQMILSDIFEKTGDKKTALLYYKAYVASRDSIFNEENTKKAVQAEMNFEFEKKEAANKLEQEKKEVIALAEKKKQNIILFAVSAFGLLILGFALFAYRSYLQKNRSNIEINEQKRIIEQKQKEVIDSIYYARRIQRSLLPNERYINKILVRLRQG